MLLFNGIARCVDEYSFGILLVV